MTMSPTSLTAGPARLYVGLFGAVEPLAAAINDAPAASAWVEVGLTVGGTTLTVERTYLELKADQLADRLGSKLTGRSITVGTQLAEVTLDNYAAAQGSGVVTDGSGYETFEPTDGDVTPDGDDAAPTYVALLLDSVGPDGKRRRAVVRKVLATASVGLAMTMDAQQVFPVTWTAHYVSSAILPYQVWQAV